MSGSLPMSSATTESTICVLLRLMLCADCKATAKARDDDPSRRRRPPGVPASVACVAVSALFASLAAGASGSVGGGWDLRHGRRCGDQRRQKQWSTKAKEFNTPHTPSPLKRQMGIQLVTLFFMTCCRDKVTRSIPATLIEVNHLRSGRAGC